MDAPKKLTNLQIELLRLFRYELPEEQLLEIRQLLVRYFAEKIDYDMDRLWEERNWTEDTMRVWAREHLRTPYRSLEPAQLQPA